MSTLKDLLIRLSQRGHSDTVAALDLIDRKKWNERAHRNWDRCTRQADTVFQSICPGAEPAPGAETHADPEDNMGDKIFVNNGLMLSDESTQALLRAMAVEEGAAPVPAAPAATHPGPSDLPPDPVATLATLLWTIAGRLLPLLLTAGITLAIAKAVFVDTDTNSTYDAQALEYIPEGSIDVP